MQPWEGKFNNQEGNDKKTKKQTSIKLVQLKIHYLVQRNPTCGVV